MSTANQTDQLLQTMKERGVSVPRGKKEAHEGVDRIVNLVKEHGEGDVDEESVIAGCEHLWGLTKTAAKKRKAELDARVPGPVGKKSVVDKELVEWPIEDKGASLRELAERLRVEAKKRGIALPEPGGSEGLGSEKVPNEAASSGGKGKEETAATIASCTKCLQESRTDRGTVDVIKALARLQEMEGTADLPKTRNNVGDIKAKENTPLVEALRELAAYYFKKGHNDVKWRVQGAMLQRGATAIRDLEWAITPEHMPVASGKSPDKIPNVGAGTIAYISEYLQTGKISRLEEAQADE